MPAIAGEVADALMMAMSCATTNTDDAITSPEVVGPTTPTM